MRAQMAEGADAAEEGDRRRGSGRGGEGRAVVGGGDGLLDTVDFDRWLPGLRGGWRRCGLGSVSHEEQGQHRHQVEACSAGDGREVGRVESGKVVFVVNGHGEPRG
jgi:hypothetical protein